MREGGAIAVDPLEGEYRAVGGAELEVVAPVAQWVLLRDAVLSWNSDESLRLLRSLLP